MQAFIGNKEIFPLGKSKEYDYISGASPLTLSGSENGDITYLEIRGNLSQAGTPSFDNYVPITTVGSNGVYVNISNNANGDTERISIPSYVTVSGRKVYLKFAKFGQNVDYLSVDKISEKVLYHQKVGYFDCTSNKTFYAYEYSSTVGVYCFMNNYPQSSLGRPAGISVVNNLVGGYYTAGAVWVNTVGTSNVDQGGALYWLSILTNLGFTDTSTRIDDFKAWLKENEDSGKPIEFYYTLGTNEKVYDLTSTSWAQSLLDITSGKNTTITVESSLPPESVSATYPKFSGKKGEFKKTIRRN